MNELLSEKDARAVDEILTDRLAVQEAQLSPDARLREDLGSDSLDDVEIVMALEERFDVVIPDEMAGGISTVGDIYEALATLLQTAERPPDTSH